MLSFIVNRHNGFCRCITDLLHGHHRGIMHTPPLRATDIMGRNMMIDDASKRLFEPAFLRPRLDSAEGASMF
jgi:hypothetical protein